MLQLVSSPHALSLHSTRVLLACTNCAVDDTAGAISERVRPLLDLGFPGRRYLCRRCCSLCSLRTPRAFTRPGFFWQARTVSLMLQLLQSPNALCLYSTRVLLAGTKCATDAADGTVSEHVESSFDLCSTTRHTVSPMLHLVQSQAG